VISTPITVAKEHDMPDPYRIIETSEASEPARPRQDRWGVLRPALWLLLVLSAAANAVTSSTGLPVLIGIGFGSVALACAVALAVQHYRHRAR
jgi:hypothetical protein